MRQQGGTEEPREGAGTWEGAGLTGQESEASQVEDLGRKRPHGEDMRRTWRAQVEDLGRKRPHREDMRRTWGGQEEDLGKKRCKDPKEHMGGDTQDRPP